jgi:hypothetical protein
VYVAEQLALDHISRDAISMEVHLPPYVCGAVRRRVNEADTRPPSRMDSLDKYVPPTRSRTSWSEISIRALITRAIRSGSNYIVGHSRTAIYKTLCGVVGITPDCNCKSCHPLVTSSTLVGGSVFFSPFSARRRADLMYPARQQLREHGRRGRWLAR